MKLACSSAAFDERFRSGDLTQLEWVDLCAHELAADGAVFDVRHFPRTDTDYLAQIKKMAADTGLTVAALSDAAFFSASDDRMKNTFEMALAVGAPLLCSTLPAETQTSWSEVKERLDEGCSLAKRANVTLAVRNVPQTFAASSHDLKRVAKEADSAWLRFGPDLDRFEASDDRDAILARSVIAFFPAGEPSASARLLTGFRGFAVLDDAAGTSDAGQMKNALHAWRRAFSDFEVNRT
ncbi:MAG TPA: TIM barrel protein [Candidatus Baltobacteraceae bacterium]|nr:TIM barrel protein [Candidatus Baltobacteraceae bacterium]